MTRETSSFATAVLAASFVLAASRPAFAAEPGSRSESTAPAGGGLAAVSARVVGNVIFYRACAQTPCTAGPADTSMPVPAATSSESLVVESLSIGAGRHALWVHSPSFGVLLAAPSPTEARVLWSGALGYTKGELGERHGDLLEVTEPEPDGTVRVLVGEVREDVTICGRSSILSPKVLDPKDLAFKSARIQRLRQSERQRAIAITAEASAPTTSTQGVARILQGAAASSGIGVPAALTDGDLETTWAENRGGEGNGEFVVLNAPEQVAITSVSIVARPKTKDVPKGAAPHKFWIATADSLFAVTVPSDPWVQKGASFDVKFPTPLHTRCVSIVLDEAYVRGKAADAEVTLAEVTAHTELDGLTDPAALAGALAGGKDRARMAAAILARAGDRAIDAVILAYPTLDDAGRVLALEVVDNASCPKSAPVYAKAMEIGLPGEVQHATDRLVRCGRDAAPALSAVVDTGGDAQKIGAANLLALLAPDTAVGHVVPLLASSKPDVRAELRAALTKAVESPAAKAVALANLSDTKLPLVATIDLLRAATARSTTLDGAGPAFARLATKDAEFRTRYLLLAPAAALAKTGDPRAEDFLVGAITSDPDTHVRARAAEVANDVPKALESLQRAAHDVDPRVRDAALASLSRLLDPKGTQRLAWSATLVTDVASLVEADPFTFVRAHAVDALAFAPLGEQADEPLAGALSDPSPVVRARVVETLGRRGAHRFASDIRDRLDDDAEILEVRARAARALGRLCDAKSADRLTELAQKIAPTGVSGDSLVIGAAAVSALGRLYPPDIAKRLAPLTDKGASRVAQELAKSAMASPERCR